MHFIRRLKEIMRIMGLNDSVHWLTWFILCAAVMLTTATLLAIILKVTNVLLSCFLLLPIKIRFVKDSRADLFNVKNFRASDFDIKICWISKDF